MERTIGLQPTPAAAEAVEALEAARRRALRTLHAAVEHELRSPLNGIALNVDLLRAELAGVEGDAGRSLRETADRLRLAVDRVAWSIELVLRVALPATEAAESFDLSRTVREISRLVAVAGRSTRVRLQVDLPAEPITMAGDEDALRGALLVLAAEMLAAASPRGRCDITLRREAEGHGAYLDLMAAPESGDLPASDPRDAAAAAAALAAIGVHLEPRRESGMQRYRLSIPLDGLRIA
jgi:nitrogen-specific signal transduction histidine kinase